MGLKLTNYHANQLLFGVLQEYGVTRDRLRKSTQRDTKAKAIKRIYAHRAEKRGIKRQDIAEALGCSVHSVYYLQAYHSKKDILTASIIEMDSLLKNTLLSAGIDMGSYLQRRDNPKRGNHLSTELFNALKQFISQARDAGYSYRQIARYVKRDHKQIERWCKYGKS